MSTKHLVSAAFAFVLLVFGAACTEEMGYCDPGTLGCACLEDTSCRGPNLGCVGGTCVRQKQEGCTGADCPPANPQCYTPCSGSFTDANGIYRSCSAEGLMPGCLSGTRCVDGSCLAQASAALTAPACTTPVDCPDHQSCMGGRCYSECETSAECAAGESCNRHVCRQACRDTSECGDTTLACREGACVPMVDAPSGQPAPPPGVISVDRSWIQLTTNVDDGGFVVTNATDRSQVLVVRKLEERTIDRDGRHNVLRAAGGELPLPWLHIGADDALAQDRFSITLAPGQARTIVVARARNPDLPRWTGAIEISGKGVASQVVSLAYSETVEGRWAGKIYSFGNFEDGVRPGIAGNPLDRWIEDRAGVAAIDLVPNAFLQAWARFRNNTFSLAEMQALVSSTLTGSWQSARVKELCREAGYGTGAACAPFGGVGSEAVLLYTSSALDNPVPSGVVELDLAFNLRQATPSEIAGDPRCSGNANCFLGRIESSEALQYGGNPALHLTFGGDPTACQSVGAAGCINFVEDLGAQILLGGRYLPTEADPTCTGREGMVAVEYPWLVPGFMPQGAMPGVEGGQRTRRECRDERVPFSSMAARNVAWSGANPVPDGKPRQRRLELVDAMLVEQHMMLLLVREVSDAFHGGVEELASYAYVVLEKQPIELDPLDYLGEMPMDDRPQAPSVLDVACDDDLIRAITGQPRTRPIEALSKAELRALARAVVRGDTSAIGDAPPPAVDTDGVEQVQYLCIWNEDGVEGASGAAGATLIRREVFGSGPMGIAPCQAGATVIYFTTAAADFGEAFDASQESCNAVRPENCLQTLHGWVMSDTHAIRLSPQGQALFPDAPGSVEMDLVYQCEGADDLSNCPDDRYEMRAGKRFLSANATQIFFHPIETDIREAFRYRTQFVSRSGKNVGFAPTICEGASNLQPYCYDPALIEEVEERVDCALAIYHHHLDANRFDTTVPDDAATLDTLRFFLRKSFALEQRFDAVGNPIVEFGFERLYAELLIMQGDDAYTASFASRFDLAGSSQLVFEGDRFEQGGLVLSGGAGFEMYKLYQAVQHYQMVLDRFYAMSPLLWSSLDQPLPLQYVTEATVTAWLERVTRASTQTANAWAEIARRYQALNRPDLARQVLERAYTRGWQESSILTKVMTQMTLAVSPAGIAQVRTEIEKAQRGYKVALLAMRLAYDKINDEVNYFGLPPDHVPFPALDPSDLHGFDVIFARAQQKARAAATLEDRALAQNREYDVDEQVFQSELVTIRNTYERELGSLCGTFTGVDGRVYPAIPRYAHLSAETAEMNDPCAEVGHGQIWLKLGDIQGADLEVERARREIENLRAETNDAQEWVAVQCNMVQEEVNRFLLDQRAIDDWQGSVDSMDVAISMLDKTLSIIDGVANYGTDTLKITTPWGQLGAVAQASIWFGAASVHFTATSILEGQIRRHQGKIRERERTYEAWTIGRACDHLTAELVYTLRGLQRQMDMAQIDSVQAVWNLQVELANLRTLLNERTRLESEWLDVEQLAINAAAAKTDPNIRIYKNDAIINADRAFQRSIQEAYRATRVFEYYTASSYARLDQLFLVRLVQYGDLNLQNYLADLEDAFYEFEEEFGQPDTRVDVISMRDDVLKIPRYADDGSQRQLTAAERVERFRKRLQDPALRDPQGMLSLQFATTFDRLSPLTANHKILMMEVELFGATGDDVGRIYVRQGGTGVVGNASGDRIFYTFPKRTAVLNPIFNGHRAFMDFLPGANRDVYRSSRFRERPYVQTNWEVVLNQRTESVNADIDVAGLDDILLYVYYTDFTP